MIYLLTTDRKTVNYYSLNHTLELIYFDSYPQETIKKAVESFKFFQLSTIALKKKRRMFDSYTSVYMYFLRLQRAKTTLHHLTSKRHGRWEGWYHKAAPNSVTHFRPVNCCRIEHDFFHWLYRRGVLEYMITFQRSSYATVWNSRYNVTSPVKTPYFIIDKLPI